MQFLLISEEHALVGHIVTVILAITAGVTDFRTGRIPNWLTLPPIFLGPIMWFLAVDQGAALNSLLGIFTCGFIPYLIFRTRVADTNAMGGGDVKLIAAFGAAVGLIRGIEIMMFSLLAVGFVALAWLAWDGKLLRTLGNTFYIALNPILPKKWKRKISPTLLTPVRLGVGFTAGAILSLFYRNQHLIWG